MILINRLIILMILVLYSMPALSQESSLLSQEESLSVQERAAEFYNKGEALYEQEKYQDAIDMYQNAHKLAPHPNNVYNMAKCYEKLSDYENAIRYYELYLAEYRNFEKMEPPELKNIENTISFLKDRLFLSLPEVMINSDPEGANIYIDDENKIVGQTPFTTHLDFGTHNLKLILNDFESVNTVFEIKSHEKLRLQFDMKKSIKMGGLKFDVNIKKARIYLDGKVFAVTPYKDMAQVIEGKHQVLIDKDRYTQSVQDVYVGRDKIVDIKAELFLENPAYSWRGYLGWTSSILGLGSMGASIFYLRPLANNEFKGTDNFNRFKMFNNIGYISGGALVAAGLGLIIWEYTRKTVETEDLVINSSYKEPQ